MHDKPKSGRIRGSVVHHVIGKAVAAGVALMFASSAVGQPAAHEHGVADLRIAVDGTVLLIEFDSPLESLVGFEHAPTTPEQRSALAAVEQRLKDFDGLFSLPAAAACVVREVQLESPYPQTAGDHDDHDHDHDGDHDDAHADMYVAYELSCTSPSALDAVGVGLIEAFPRIRAIRAETASPRGQGSVRLDRSGSMLPL